jgi:hypothetical protein
MTAKLRMEWRLKLQSWTVVEEKKTIRPLTEEEIYKRKQ